MKHLTKEIEAPPFSRAASRSTADSARAVGLKDARDLRAALNEHAIVAITDSKGRIIFANAKFCAISGYSRGELMGEDLRLINSGYHPKEFFRGLWNTIASGKPWHGEIRNRAKNGAHYWVAATIVPFPDEDGRPRQYLSIQTDVTEQKRLDLELENKLRLQRLLANLSARFAGLPSAEVDAAIQLAQHLVVETFGLDRSMLWQFNDGGTMALTHRWQRPGWSPLPNHFDAEADLTWAFGKVMLGEIFSFMSLDKLPREAARDSEVFRSHGLKSKVIFPLIADGKVFGALAFATLEREHDWLEEEIDDLKLVAQIIGNVLGRQRAENRFEQLRAEVTHSARLAMLGEMSAALAHELNQPLTAILSNAQAGRRFISGGEIQSAEIRPILDDIVRDSKRAGGVIHNLRGMLGKTPINREACSIGGIIEEVIEFMHGELVGHKVELRSELADDLPQVEAARVELQQVLMNLIVNGVQAMETTPVGSRIIEISAYCVAGTVIVSVRDHGCGIPAGNLTSIFDPFHTTKSTGLGMGLAICRRFVEAHSGHIKVSNHANGGARFSFSLPAIAAEG